MINILICSTIVLCFAVIAYGAIFINYEVSKEKELAEICSCDVRTITNVVDDLSKENDFLTQIHIKKGD